MTSTFVAKDADGKQKGFGFVCFKNFHIAMALVCEIDSRKERKEDDPERKAEKAVKGIKPTDLTVLAAKKKEERELEFKQKLFKFKKSVMYFSLFVKNFPPGTTEEELKEFLMRAIPNEHDDVITKIAPI